MRSAYLILLVACAPPGPIAMRDRSDATGGWPEGVTLRVCAGGGGDFTDIQPAVDASIPGDVIGVCPGTYGPVKITWGVDVDIIGLGGPNQTFIEGAGRPAELDEGTLDLRGFHLRGDGLYDPYFPKAGGFSLYEGTASLTNSIVEGATGPFTVLFDEDFFVMEDVVFRDNNTQFLWYLWQGEDDEGLIGSARITNNTVIGGTHETLIETDKVVDLVLANNVFAHVRIDTGFSAFVFRREGGGLLQVHNNMFYDIDDLAPTGGRLFEMNGNADFRNNIVVGCDAYDLMPMDGSYSLFFDNGVDYAPMVNGEGNLFVDPMFTDPDRLDFSLRPGSPAIDAGDPETIYVDDDGTRNDMGANGGPIAM